MSYSIYSMSFDGYLRKWNGVDAWINVAYLPISGEEVAHSMFVYNDEIYVGKDGGDTAFNPIYKWNKATIFESLLYLTTTIGVRSMVYYDGYVYAAGEVGCLRRLNPPTFDIVTSQIGYVINQLLVFSGKIYAALNNGYFAIWDGVGDWEVVYESYAWADFYSIVEHNSKVYVAAGTYLWYWNGVDELVMVCDHTAGSEYTYSMIDFNSNLYAGSHRGALSEFTGGNTWTLRAPNIDGYAIRSNCMVEYNGKLYAGNYHGRLLEWNGVDAWSVVAEDDDYHSIVGIGVCLDPSLNKYKAWIM